MGHGLTEKKKLMKTKQKENTRPLELDVWEKLSIHLFVQKPSMQYHILTSAKPKTKGPICWTLVRLTIRSWTVPYVPFQCGSITVCLDIQCTFISGFSLKFDYNNRGNTWVKSTIAYIFNCFSVRYAKVLPRNKISHYLSFSTLFSSLLSSLEYQHTFPYSWRLYLPI